MAEREINKRKVQFLENLAPVSASLDELIREKLECGRFPLTKTGWVKVVAILIGLAGLALFLAQPWGKCSEYSDWYDIVFPVCVGCNVVVQLSLYMIFSCGGTIKYPGKWVTADIILNLIFAVVGIVGSVMTIANPINCTENPQMLKIPGPLGITAGVASVIGCGAIFLMYRYVEDEEEEEAPKSPMERNIDLRKSMHA